MAHRPAPRRPLRRDPDRVRPFQHGGAVHDDVLCRPVCDCHRHRPPEGQRERHRRRALREERHPPRRGLLHLLHGHQPGCLRRAAHLRLPRAEDHVARGVCGGGLRHANRCDPVRPGRPVPRRRRQDPAPAESVEAGALVRRRAIIWGILWWRRSPRSPSRPTPARSGSRRGRFPTGRGRPADCHRGVLRLAVSLAWLDASGTQTSTPSGCCFSRRRCSGRSSSRRARR